MSDDARPQDLHIFQPYGDEWPWHLLDGCDEVAPPDDWDLLRLARCGDEVVGLYVLVPLNAMRYRLELLLVDPRYRHRGFGRWLLGHAVGLAETKGGRHLQLAGGRSGRFFRRFGFVPDGDGLRYDLVPE